MNKEKAIAAHINAFEDWKEGQAVDNWIDEDGYLCIEYESGNWWHYAQDGNEIVWW